MELRDLSFALNSEIFVILSNSNKFIEKKESIVGVIDDKLVKPSKLFYNLKGSKDDLLQ